MNLQLVMTTIRVPEVLKQLTSIEGADSVTFHVVGDHRTDARARAFVESLGQVDARFYPVVQIEEELSDRAHRLHGFNHDSLRVFGFRKAFEAQADVVLSLDDDNQPASDSFFPTYRELFDPTKPPPVTLPSNPTREWVNSFVDNGYYPRGFPYAERGREAKLPSNVAVACPVYFHQGLTWIDADVDALTRSVRDGKLDQAHLPDRVMGGWQPVNAQNAAIRREYLPFWWAPSWCGRQWDIVAGLLVQSLLRSVNGYWATSGIPFSYSYRNAHSIEADIAQEAVGQQVVDELRPWLMLGGLRQWQHPIDAYRSLAKLLQTAQSRLLWHLGEGMLEWADYVETWKGF